MPTVRSPCTFECPRTGHKPAPRAADIAAHHHQVRQDLHRRHGVLVLREAHAPRRDHCAALHVDVGELQHVFKRHARFGDDGVPAFGTQIVGERIEADRVFGDERSVEHAFADRRQRFVVELDHAFGDALDQARNRRRPSAG